jgi:hypothetical protein
MRTRACGRQGQWQQRDTVGGLGLACRHASQSPMCKHMCLCAVDHLQVVTARGPRPWLGPASPYQPSLRLARRRAPCPLSPPPPRGQVRERCEGALAPLWDAVRILQVGACSVGRARSRCSNAAQRRRLRARCAGTASQQAGMRGIIAQGAGSILPTYVWRAGGTVRPVKLSCAPCVPSDGTCGSCGAHEPPSLPERLTAWVCCVACLRRPGGACRPASGTCQARSRPAQAPSTPCSRGRCAGSGQTRRVLGGARQPAAPSTCMRTLTAAGRRPLWPTAARSSPAPCTPPVAA